jgi:hypothetical protein
MDSGLVRMVSTELLKKVCGTCNYGSKDIAREKATGGSDTTF